ILEAGLPIIKERMAKLTPGPVNGKIPLMIGGSGEKVTLRLVAQHADQLNTFGPPDNFKKKNDILNEWCAKVGRNPKDIERTVAVRPEELEKVDEYAAAGADHMIVMLSNPYDLSAVEKFVASTR
ncbi:MAG: LLM class flavin-dependent oxidoreductase, partial [Ilumatobacteraceae bacterium]